MNDPDFPYYDLDALKRFIEKVDKNFWEAHGSFVQEQHRLLLAGELSSDGDKLNFNLAKDLTHDELLAAARALSAVIVGGVDLKEKLGLTFRRGPKSPKKLNHTIHSGEFAAVVSFEARAITHVEAQKLIMLMCGVEKTAAGKYIKDMRATAKKLIETFGVAIAVTKAGFLKMEDVKAKLEELKIKPTNFF